LDARGSFRFWPTTSSQEDGYLARQLVCQLSGCEIGAQTVDLTLSSTLRSLKPPAGCRASCRSWGAA